MVDLELIAVISRCLTVPFVAGMVSLFWTKYKESDNKYFRGYFLFFIGVLGIQISTSILDIFTLINPDSTLSAFSSGRFADYQSSYEDTLLFLDNMLRPSYLLIYIVLLIAFGSQIQPIEIFTGKDKQLFSKTLFILIPLVALIFVPILRYTYYAFGVLLIASAAILFGFLYNILMNLSLTIKSVGAIRKRTFLVLIGFICYLIGLLWGARTGYSEYIYYGLKDSNYDIIIGSGIVLFACLLYYIGFKSSEI
jgi:hypothetical protein